MAAAIGLAKQVGATRACEGLGIPRASFYRHLALVHGPRPKRPKPVRALTTGEREAVLAHLHSERFQDQSPVEVAAVLLDEGRYHCSARTMHRLLAEAGQSRERCDQLVHPPYQKHELLARASNQLWSWDITKLLGPAKAANRPGLGLPRPPRTLRQQTA